MIERLVPELFERLENFFAVFYFFFLFHVAPGLAFWWCGFFGDSLRVSGVLPVVIKNGDLELFTHGSTNFPRAMWLMASAVAKAVMSARCSDCRSRSAESFNSPILFSMTPIKRLTRGRCTP